MKNLGNKFVKEMKDLISTMKNYRICLGSNADFAITKSEILDSFENISRKDHHINSENNRKTRWSSFV